MVLPTTNASECDAFYTTSMSAVAQIQVKLIRPARPIITTFCAAGGKTIRLSTTGETDIFAILTLIRAFLVILCFRAIQIRLVGEQVEIRNLCGQNKPQIITLRQAVPAIRRAIYPKTGCCEQHYRWCGLGQSRFWRSVRIGEKFTTCG